MSAFRLSVWAPAVVLSLLLSACGPEWPPAPASGFASCGSEEMGMGETLNVEGRRCLLAAYRAGEKAEFASAGRSVEGDPIHRVIRVHARGVVEVLHDARQDRFGSGRVERLQCEALVPVEEVNNPPDLFLPLEMVFIEDGCREWPAD
jgi:hypothetical protein